MHDWQGLARKVATGCPLEEAAAAFAIPLEEIIAHAKERLAAGDALPWQLRLVGQNALHVAVARLEKIAGGGPRVPKWASDTDRRAAEALAKIGVATIKLSQPVATAKGVAPGASGTVDRGPWAGLKEPGV